MLSVNICLTLFTQQTLCVNILEPAAAANAGESKEKVKRWGLDLLKLLSEKFWQNGQPTNLHSYLVS